METLHSTRKDIIVIDRVGIETELYCQGGVELDGVELNDYKDTEDGQKFSVDREYYETQVEYKLLPEKFNPTTTVQNWSKFIKSRLSSNEYGVTDINGRDWVGTHIHLFLGKNGVQFTEMRRIKPLIVDMVLKDILKSLADGTAPDEMYTRYELERIVRSHSLWRYFDNENRMKANMRMMGFGYSQFSDGIDKPKYAPVIYSLATDSGKPQSLEVRIVPNSFLLHSPDKVAKWIQRWEDLINADELNTREEYEVRRSIYRSHLILCGLFVRMCSMFNPNKAGLMNYLSTIKI